MALSFVQYAGNGSTATFAVPFKLLDPTHIQVRVNLDIAQFTWATPNTLRISPTPPAGAVIEIRRVTPRESPMVDFVDGSVLTETDLDLAVAQVFYIVQEAIDIAGGTLELLADGSYGAGGRRIKNLGNALEPRDAITKEYHDGTFLPQMVALLEQATAARDVSNQSRDGAVAALNAANAARNLALQYRNTADAHRAAAAQSEANAKGSADASQAARTGSEAARDTSSAHRLNAQNARTATEAARDVTLEARDVTLGYRDATKGYMDNAKASADRAAAFDPSTFHTKGRSLEIMGDDPTLWMHYPGRFRKGWTVNVNGVAVLQDQGGQAHFYVTPSGGVWTQEFGDLNNRIETRAAAHATARAGERASSDPAGRCGLIWNGNPNFRIDSTTIQLARKSESDTAQSRANDAWSKANDAQVNRATKFVRFGVEAVYTGSGSLSMTTPHHADFHWAGDGFYYRVDANAYQLIGRGASDARFKDVQGPLTDALGLVGKLSPVVYEFKADVPIGVPSGERAGFLAQDLKELMPNTASEVGIPGEDGSYLALEQDAPMQLIAVLTKAVQELAARVEALEAKA